MGSGEGWWRVDGGGRWQWKRVMAAVDGKPNTAIRVRVDPY